ncbi:MAG: Gfo/Idh/MocA family oxidoreductase [Bacilli bacterium]|nr:Gfo/Idh/MocA family oxidoreductase [Bacilli bacterium]
MNKTKRAALIGLGTIVTKYKEGLLKSNAFELAALMDISEGASGRLVFPNLPFYTSLDELIKNEEVNLAIISTPPATHYSLIKKCLKQGLDVIVEKPMVLKIEQVEELYSFAKNKGLCLNTSYHWQNGEEVKHFSEIFCISKITKIDIFVNDPYSNGQEINDAKIPLEGTWIDSGVNSLSLAKKWLPFKEFTILGYEIKLADNVKLPIYSKVNLLIDGVEVNIEVDWRENLDFKRSYVYFGDHKVFINHSEQKIYDGDKVYNFDSIPRLNRHYYNFYTSFAYTSNYEETEAIHKILLKVRDEYEKKNN